MSNINKATILILFLAISVCAVTLWPRTHVFQPEARHTFTWIGCHVNETLADWASNLNFTDAVVRYDSDMAGSMSVLLTRGITFWMYVGAHFFDWTSRTDQSTQFYKTELEKQVALSPSGNIYVDDCHMLITWHGEQALGNFLEATRQVNTGNVLIDLYMASSVINCDMRNLDIDIYQGVQDSFASLTSDLALNNPKSVGLYLWAWHDISLTWATMTEQLIEKKYGEAVSFGCTRMIVWNGYETDAVEKGMYEASLYNYPQLWSLIASLNRNFLSS